ncbi:hypothetical protein D9M69_725080 [compost metagenome]
MFVGTDTGLHLEAIFDAEENDCDAKRPAQDAGTSAQQGTNVRHHNVTQMGVSSFMVILSV